MYRYIDRNGTFWILTFKFTEFYIVKLCTCYDLKKEIPDSNVCNTYRLTRVINDIKTAELCFVGWTLKTKTSFRFDSPVWLLGKFYHIKPSGER